MSNRWLLPENMADILPFDAQIVEKLRRGSLDLFSSYGYELVIPPMFEYLESLLTGTGSDLDLQMFKLVDQASGRTLGLRADMTPQVARIDAHILNREDVTRLCYAGTTLHSRILPGMFSREQLQVGAELYGSNTWEADLEIITLMLEALHQANIGVISLDLCHAGLLKELLTTVEAAMQQKISVVADLYAALQAKDRGSLIKMTQLWPDDAKKVILALLHLSGEADQVLQEAQKILPRGALTQQVILDLRRLCNAIKSLSPQTQLNIDLADLDGFQYHTGVMSAAYVKDYPVAIARGGRYDQVGLAFGRSRPATGFSMDILEVARLSQVKNSRTAISAPWSDDAALKELIAQLRVDGQVVIQELPESKISNQGCDRRLTFENGKWQITPILKQSS